MNANLKNPAMLPTWIGSALGFVSYLFVGAVPGLLYGGYMGLVMAGVMLGTPVDATLLAKVITGGGMLLGLLASLFFFLVVGALAGTIVGLPFTAALRRTQVSEQAPVSVKA